MLTTRLQLRLIEPRDWPAVHSWGGDANACRHQPWGPNTVAQSQEFTTAAVAASHSAPCTRKVYIARLDDDAVGCAELKIRSRQHAQGEIQYIVHPRLWGRGIGTAIARALLRSGFEDDRLHRIYATCDPDNTASTAILRRLGMSYEGRMRQVIRVDGHWRDRLKFSMLTHEHCEVRKYLLAGPRDRVLHIIHGRRCTGNHRGIRTHVFGHRARLGAIDSR